MTSWGDARSGDSQAIAEVLLALAAKEYRSKSNWKKPGNYRTVQQWRQRPMLADPYTVDRIAVEEFGQPAASAFPDSVWRADRQKSPAKQCEQVAA